MLRLEIELREHHKHVAEQEGDEDGLDELTLEKSHQARFPRDCPAALHHGAVHEAVTQPVAAAQLGVQLGEIVFLINISAEVSANLLGPCRI